ncbi:MAG: DUF899 family protein [Bryobacteraceae bacterium]
MTHLTFPNETGGYRSARNALLAEEIASRKQIEAVAALRRALRTGGEVPEDYLFERIDKNFRPEKVQMSKLLARSGRSFSTASCTGQSGIYRAPCARTYSIR